MKVIVIENDKIGKQQIRAMLVDINWTLLAIVGSIEEIHPYLKENTPDLIIVNMFLGTKNSHTDLLKQTKERNIPVLFIIPYNEKNTPSSESKSINFVLSPFHQVGFKAVTSLLAFNKPAQPTGIEIRDKQQQKKIIPFEDILWIEVERNYCFLKTQNSRYGLIKSLNKLMPLLDKRFVQIHRNCVVNTDCIDSVKIAQQELRVNKTLLPIGRLYKTNVLAFLAQQK
jgi:DNA-binding LytR/AlgR family response regulator